MSVGERIKARRKELGLSVEQVANALGKDRATIYRYESNDIENLPITVLEPLAHALETTPAYLMGWDREIDDLDRAVLGVYPNFVPGQNHLPTSLEGDDIIQDEDIRVVARKMQAMTPERREKLKQIVDIMFEDDDEE